MNKLRINRDTFYDYNNKRLDILDSRYYFKLDSPEIFYPSVTTVLEAFPKGWALETWKKQLGMNADRVLEEAAKEGSIIHDAINKYLLGKVLKFGEIVNDEFVANYTLSQWQMILKFVEFWTTYKPVLIATEVVLISEAHRIGLTIDLVCEIAGEVWLIDAKSGNGIYDTHELQLAAYATVWNEQNPDYFIQRAGVLHLKALTRGADKSGKKIQGEGWQLKEFDRHYGEAFRVFQNLRKIWDEVNPTYKPEIYSLPTEVQMPAQVVGPPQPEPIEDHGYIVEAPKKQKKA